MTDVTIQSDSVFNLVYALNQHIEHPQYKDSAGSANHEATELVLCNLSAHCPVLHMRSHLEQMTLPVMTEQAHLQVFIGKNIQ